MNSEQKRSTKEAIKSLERDNVNRGSVPSESACSRFKGLVAEWRLKARELDKMIGERRGDERLKAKAGVYRAVATDLARAISDENTKATDSE